MRSWLHQHGIPEEVSFDVLVAVSEAQTNSVQHAYAFEPGPIEIDGLITDGTVQVTVTDHGTWRQRTTDHADGRARGLALMRTLMDVVEIDSNGNGTAVRMRRARNASDRYLA